MVCLVEQRAYMMNFQKFASELHALRKANSLYCVWKGQVSYKRYKRPTQLQSASYKKIFRSNMERFFSSLFRQY